MFVLEFLHFEFNQSYKRLFLHCSPLEIKYLNFLKVAHQNKGGANSASETCLLLTSNVQGHFGSFAPFFIIEPYSDVDHCRVEGTKISASGDVCGILRSIFDFEHVNVILGSFDALFSELGLNHNGSSQIEAD